ncbi:MAG: 4-(cytidine 5'-diphospho)-2-C-methyl-D-erythritol kinase [Betaproteobacteria bacterium]
MTLSVPAPAKLNLFLHVVGRRADGYHLLQSAFTLLDFGDMLNFRPRDDGRICRTSVLPGIHEDEDLVVRAARLLQRESACPLGADIDVEKRIPMGGGLGGGSSDAASALLALNRLWGLKFSRQRLQDLALSLGADVPFFVFGRNAWVEGVGELLQPLDIPMWWYVVLTPSAQVPTPFVFARPELTRNTIRLKIADFSASGLADTRNDLQPVVMKAFPAVAAGVQALGKLSQNSVFGARMTGSGACVFAAFEFERDARSVFSQLQPEHKGFVARGLTKHPLGD